MYKSVDRFAARVTQSSGGRLVLKPQPAGGIVPATKEFDGIHGGSLDWAQTAFAYWKDKFPAAGLFTFTVGGLTPVEQMLWHLQGGGKELAQKMVKDYNVILMPGWIGSAEIFLSTTKPLKTVADIKGLKIRTAGDDGVLFAKMGAAVVSLPSGEVYEAMKRGVIDSYQLSSPAVDYSMAMHEVAKYIYISPARQPSEYHAWLFNKDVWNTKLTDDLRALIEDAALAEAWKYYALITKMDSEAVAKYKAYGVAVAPIPKEIEDEMAKQADIFYKEQAAKDALFNEIYTSLTTFQKTIRESAARL